MKILNYFIFEKYIPKKLYKYYPYLRFYIGEVSQLVRAQDS